MLVHEQALDADVAFGSACAFGCVGFQDACFFDLDAGQVKHRQETDFPIGRLEHRVALVEHKLGDQVLRECGLRRFAAQVDRAARWWRCRGNRCRNAAALKRRVRNKAEREEPVLTECRAITLEHIVTVVRVPQTLGIAECRSRCASDRGSPRIRAMGARLRAAGPRLRRCFHRVAGRPGVRRCRSAMNSQSGARFERRPFRPVRQPSTRLATPTALR